MHMRRLLWRSMPLTLYVDIEIWRALPSSWCAGFTCSLKLYIDKPRLGAVPYFEDEKAVIHRCLDNIEQN